MTPLVTIGIPCYNSERWIRAAIDSALTQTWGNCEVIVVDDGSTDNTLLYASVYGDRITLLRTAHQGAPAARNLILRESRGEWVQYLDADDYLLPDKLSRQLSEAADGENADIIYSPVLEEVTSELEKVRSESFIDRAKDLYGQWLAWELPQTGGALWRRSALETLNGWRPDQPCCQEHELYLRALQAGLRFVFSPTPGAIYRIWSDQTLCRKDPRLVIHVKTKLIDQLRSWMQQKKIWTEKHRQIAARACFEMARTLAQVDRRGAAQYFRQRRRHGLIKLAGPAAPRAYRYLYRFLGFAGTEHVARLLRR